MIVKSTPEIVIACFYISFVLKPEKKFVSRGYLNKLSNKENGMSIICCDCVIESNTGRLNPSVVCPFLSKGTNLKTEQTINLFFLKSITLAWDDISTSS